MMRPPTHMILTTSNLFYLKKLKKLDLPRLQFSEKLRVRQYIISDSATIFYTEYYSTLRGISSADWQQQMRVTPTHFCTSDLRSN